MTLFLHSFQAPGTEIQTGVQVQISPTVELAYAYMTLLTPPTDRPPEWLALLQEQQPVWLSQLRDFWPSVAPDLLGFSFLNMVCSYGYALNSVERFLHDLEYRMPDLLVMAEAQGQHIRETDPERRALLQQIHREYVERLRQLLDPQRRHSFVSLIQTFWISLEAAWTGEGEERAARATEEFDTRYAASRDVLSALPAHHFARFESSAAQIRQAVTQRRVLVFPLFFCLSGGFIFDTPGTIFIGYGIQTDDQHQQLVGEVTAMANQLKALADPTRLLLLTLLAQKQRFDLSVTDLAGQLGVTQPTVSGHLKLLRQAGFITLEKKGQKSVYRAQLNGVTTSLAEIISRLNGHRSLE